VCEREGKIKEVQRERGRGREREGGLERAWQGREILELVRLSDCFSQMIDKVSSLNEYLNEQNNEEEWNF